MDAQGKRDTSVGITQCDHIQQKEEPSVMDTKTKGQRVFPGRITEDYRKEFWIVTGPSRSLQFPHPLKDWDDDDNPTMTLF